MVVRCASCKAAFNNAPEALAQSGEQVEPASCRNRTGSSCCSVAHALASGTDLVLIAAVLSPAAVTPYTITDKLVSTVSSIPLIVMGTAQPALSELSASSDRTRLPDICIALTRVVFLACGLIAVVVIVVSEGFVSWWIGPQEFGGKTLVVLLVADMVVAHWTTATSYALFSLGYERFIAIISIISGSLIAILTAIFVRSFGIIGAALAPMTVRAVLTLPALLVAISRATNGLVKDLLVSVFSWAWRAALLGAAAVTAARLITPRSVVGLAAAGLATALVYSLVMLPLALDEPLGTYTRPRFMALRQALLRRA